MHHDCEYFPIKTRAAIIFINSEDPDRTPRVAASDKGLHCLSASLLWDMRHKLSYSTGKIREIFVKICMGT